MVVRLINLKIEKERETERSSVAVMESLHVSVMLILSLATPLIKAYVPGQKPKPALLRGMRVICFDPKDVCKFEPCQNGGTCSVTGDKNQPHKCDCAFGHGGANCEKKLGELARFSFYLAPLMTAHYEAYSSFLTESMRVQRKKLSVSRKWLQVFGVLYCW